MVGLSNLHCAYHCELVVSGLFARILVFSSRLDVIPGSICDYDRRFLLYLFLYLMRWLCLNASVSRDKILCPYSTCQTRTVKSRLVEAMYLLLGDQASLITTLAGP